MYCSINRLAYCGQRRKMTLCNNLIKKIAVGLFLRVGLSFFGVGSGGITVHTLLNEPVRAITMQIHGVIDKQLCQWFYSILCFRTWKHGIKTSSPGYSSFLTPVTSSSTHPRALPSSNFRYTIDQLPNLLWSSFMATVSLQTAYTDFTPRLYFRWS